MCCYLTVYRVRPPDHACPHKRSKARKRMINCIELSGVQTFISLDGVHEHKDLKFITEKMKSWVNEWKETRELFKVPSSPSLCYISCRRVRFGVARVVTCSTCMKRRTAASALVQEALMRYLCLFRSVFCLPHTDGAAAGRHKLALLQKPNEHH